MIKVENIAPWGFEHAIRGMRNPLNSWNKSDSKWVIEDEEYPNLSAADFKIGPNDLDLMRRLYKAGTEHRKYLRQIFVSFDITAPLYWWKEFDTYKVGTVSNSCSTMHKIASKEFNIDDFSHEQLSEDIIRVTYDDQDYLNSALDCFYDVIAMLNTYRERYLKTKDKKDWWQLIQLLPSSYNQKRTITMNYENVFNIIHQRENHKLDEWRDFVKILLDLPYVKEIME